MKKSKIIDACILIETIQQNNFSQLYLLWKKNYNIYVTKEILDEVDGWKDKNFARIIQCFKILDKVPEEKLIFIKKQYPKLSTPDCSIFYHCIEKKLDIDVVLTSDMALRNALEKNRFIVHGFMGILLKLKNNGDFDSEFLKKTFEETFLDQRLCPPDLLPLI